VRRSLKWSKKCLNRNKKKQKMGVKRSPKWGVKEAQNGSKKNPKWE
jgi:hypothetical protein